MFVCVFCTGDGVIELEVELDFLVSVRACFQRVNLAVELGRSTTRD